MTSIIYDSYNIYIWNTVYIIRIYIRHSSDVVMFVQAHLRNCISRRPSADSRVTSIPIFI